MADDSDFYGFLELGDALKEFIEVAGRVMDEEEKIAQEFVEDLLKLPSPRSDIAKSGYTHLIDTFSYKREEKEVTVGWGKFYGPILEEGATFMRQSYPHLNPLWQKNSKKYIENFKKRTNL